MSEEHMRNMGFVWGDRVTSKDIAEELKRTGGGEMISPTLLDFQVDEEEIAAFLSVYPQELLSRYSLHNLATRARVNARVRNLFDFRKEKEPHSKTLIDKIQSLPNLMFPTRIGELRHSWDSIASALVKEVNGTKSALVIMENVQYTKATTPSGYYEPGVGKTALSLTILGVTDFTERLPLFPPPGVRPKEEDFQTVIVCPDQSKDIKIIALDRTYAGLSEDQRLVVSPVSGVIAGDGQQDVARYAVRVLAAKAGREFSRTSQPDSDYYPLATHNVLLSTSLFETLDSQVPWKGTLGINFIRNLQIAELQRRQLESRGVRIHQIQNMDNSAWIALEINDNSSEVTDKMLLLIKDNPLYHPSPAWAGIDSRRQGQPGINPDHQIKTMGAIKDYLPDHLAFLYIYPGGSNYSANTAPQIFQQSAAEILDWWNSW